MYKSPIEIVSEEITTKLEDEVMTVVERYGIFVDKQELIRALKNDRSQYDKGYADGKYSRYYEEVAPYRVGKRWHCGNCSMAIGRFWKFCQNCGIKIGLSEERKK